MKIKIESTAIQQAKSDELDRLSHDYFGIKQSLDDEDYGCRMGDGIDFNGATISTEGVYSDTKDAIEANCNASISASNEYQRILDSAVVDVLKTNASALFDDSGNLIASKFQALTDCNWFSGNTKIVNFDELEQTKITAFGYTSGFNGCTSLKSVKLPNTFKTIDGLIFSQTAIEEMVIPSSVTSHIQFRAFYNCTKLKKVTIPSSVTGIDTDAFSYCSSLSEIIYQGTCDQCKAMSYEGTPFYGCPATYIQCSDGQVAISGGSIVTD